MPKELIESKPNVLCYLTKQDGRNVAPLMKGHCGASALYVSKLLMRTTLANFRETKRNENSDDFAWFENGDVSHRLRNGYVLDTHKF